MDVVSFCSMFEWICSMATLQYDAFTKKVLNVKVLSHQGMDEGAPREGHWSFELELGVGLLEEDQRLPIMLWIVYQTLWLYWKECIAIVQGQQVYSLYGSHRKYGVRWWSDEAFFHWIAVWKVLKCSLEHTASAPPLLYLHKIEISARFGFFTCSLV